MKLPQIHEAARIIRPRQSGSGAQSGAGRGWQIGAGLAAMALALSCVLPLPAQAAGPDLTLAGPAVLAVAKNEGAGIAPQKVRDERWRRENGWGDNGQRDDRRSRRLPGYCALEINTGRKMVLYSENCLDHEGIRVRLSRDCVHSARIFGRSDRLYSVNCLREAGYDTSDR